MPLMSLSEDETGVKLIIIIIIIIMLLQLIFNPSKTELMVVGNSVLLGT